VLTGLCVPEQKAVVLPWDPLDVRDDVQPRVAWYFYRMRDDGRIGEFCVANATGPNQVSTPVPGEAKAPPPGLTLYETMVWSARERQVWEMREEGDLLVWSAPDGYLALPEGENAVGWLYDRRLQQGEPMPPRELDRQALRCRVSALMDAVGGRG
jgi:hypothetical protein